MNTTAPDVIIQCICDCFQKDEIEEIENSLVPYNLHLKIEQDSKPQFLNSPFEWFFPVLQILLAPETQTALCQGLASSACYDGIIYLCRRMETKIEIGICSKGGLQWGFGFLC